MSVFYLHCISLSPPYALMLYVSALLPSTLVLNMRSIFFGGGVDRPVKILVTGMERSGSTWMYSVVRLLVEVRVMLVSR